MRHRPLSTRLGAAATIVACVLAIVAVYVISHHSSSPATSSTPSLRLDPSGTLARAKGVAHGGQTAAAISAGDYSSCALVRPATVECWGDNGYGQLGNGQKAGSLAPVQVRLGKPATSVEAGGSHACAVLQNETVDCWGSNLHGELGNGNRSDSATPVPVPGITDALAVAVGVAHTCVLRAGGGIECWGANGNGQLGDGTTTDSAKPVAVTGLTSPARTIAAGLAHTCATFTDGSVDCWGANANGELGDGTVVDSPTPVAVTGLSGPALGVDAGDAHTCALLQSGAVACWGWNIEGQLGNGGGSDSSTPVTVDALKSPATAIALGGSHTCALLQSGAVDCWGANLYGQLGNGTTSDSATPVAVSGLSSGVTAIAAGLYHSCALLDGGSATCWGWNQQGELGNGTTTSSSSPVGVARLGLAPDGSGTVIVQPRSLPDASSHTTISFRFTVAAGGMHDGTLAVTVPPGWSMPSTVRTAPGYATTTAGRVLTAGRTISVTGLTLVTGSQLIVFYGDMSRGGPGAKPRPAAAVWRIREQSSPSGNLSALRGTYVTRVLAADGSGEVATTATTVQNGIAHQTIAFDYVAALGGAEQGTLQLTVPPGWSAPSTSPAAPGYVRASKGVVSVSGRKVSIGQLSLAGDEKLHVVYGAGSEGAKAPSSSVGGQDWTFALAASASGKLQPLAASPRIDVLAPNGTGNVYGFDSTVANGQPGVQLSFTYGPDSGGVGPGAQLELTVPRGWTPPSSNPGDPGYVAASVGKARVSGRHIVVPIGTLGGGTVQVTYSGAKAPSSNVGPQQWPVRERSTGHGSLKPIPSPPTITVLSANGSGRVFRITGASAPNSSGNTVVFGYQAAPGGIKDGTIELTVPDGWSGPSTGSNDPGYVIATSGSVSTSGQTITLSHVYLDGGAVLTIVYGSRSGGGPGAHAPAHPGPATWRATEASTAGTAAKPVR